MSKEKQAPAHPLICDKQVQRLALDYARRTRAHKFSRVSKSFYEEINNAAHRAIVRAVDSHPSVGITLK